MFFSMEVCVQYFAHSIEHESRLSLQLFNSRSYGDNNDLKIQLQNNVNFRCHIAPTHSDIHFGHDFESL